MTQVCRFFDKDIHRFSVYAGQQKWSDYAKHNDRKTFMLLFEKDFPEMAAKRYEQNEEFVVKMFNSLEVMKEVMETVGAVLYERLKRKKTLSGEAVL